MSEGYKKRIDSIIDRVVEDNIKFKRKSTVNQEEEKADMARSISKAISALNDYGQKLVLDELDNIVNQQSIQFFDSTGNINVLEIFKITTTIVKAKVDEAERTGLNLRKDLPNINKDGRILTAENILAISLLDKMNKDFNSLSDSEVKNLINLYSQLSDADKRKLGNNLFEQWKNDEDIPKGIKNMIEKQEKEFNCRRDIIDALKKLDQEKITEDNIESAISQIISAHKENGVENINEEEIRKACEEQIGKNIDNLDKESGKNLAVNYDIIYRVKNKGINKITEDNIESVISQIISAYKENGVENINEEEIRKIVEKDIVDKDLDREINRTNDIFLEEYLAENINKQPGETSNPNESSVENVNEKPGVPSNPNEFSEFFSEKDEKVNENIFDEISEILLVLVKEGYSRKEISEALSKYQFIFKNMDEEDIKELKKQKPNEIKETFNDVIQENFKEEMEPKYFQALEHMINHLSGDNLQRVLNVPQFIQETLLPALSVEIEQLDQTRKDPEQQATTIDQESIREELLAIPVALSNIEGIEKDDISTGMKGYKQLLNAIDENELQGKSDEEVLKILMSKTAEIGLEGNANSILVMMSQIGFSNGGNRQIATILKESKEEFVALVDEASKEENIDKAISESKAQQLISDSEATPGMESLIVDLKFAGEKENGLENQVISEIDDGQVDSDASADSDTAQGSTSSGKIKPTQMTGLFENVKTSDVVSAQKLVTEIIKLDEKDKEDGDRSLGEDTEGLGV